MEQLISAQWSRWAFVKIAAAALLLYLLLKLVQRAFKILNVKYNLGLPYQKIFPVFEMAAWLIFVFWALKEAIIDPLYYSIIFITVTSIFIIWVAWYAGRDYVAGIIWRGQNGYSIGQKALLNAVEGKIINTGYLNVTLQKDDGAVFKIPYSKISGNMSSTKSENKVVISHKSLVEVPKKADISSMTEGLKSVLVNSPWHLSYLQPKISKVDEKEGNIILEIVVHSIGEEGIEKLQILIEEYLGPV